MSREVQQDAICDHRSDDLAKAMLENIVGEKSFDLDDIEWDDNKISIPDDLMSNWQKDVDPVTIEELTSRQAFGSGIFDALMEAVHNHLKIEYDRNRITGAEYATTYTKLTEAAMANAVQFCLQKNQAYFQGILAQAQAITAGIQAQIAAITAKVQLAKAKAEALGVAAEYALTTMKLSTEDAQHALICKQQAVANAQIAQTEAQTSLIEEQCNTQEEQTELVHNQAAGEAASTQLKQYQARLLNPDATDNKNLDYKIKQKQLEENADKARMTKYQADGLDPAATAGAGTNIDFLLKEAQKDSIDKNMDHVDSQMLVEGAQKALYDQQKISFIRKAEKDVADLFSNAYLAMKSVDEGLAIPKALSGGSINEVLQKLKTNVDLGRDTTNINAYSAGSSSWAGMTLPSSGLAADRAFLQNGILTGYTSSDNKEEDES